jgi:hypothetical protein
VPRLQHRQKQLRQNEAQGERQETGQHQQKRALQQQDEEGWS